jgi:hypothetical protein
LGSGHVCSDLIALLPSLACKSGNFATDGSVVSTMASFVSQTHAYTEAI